MLGLRQEGWEVEIRGLGGGLMLGRFEPHFWIMVALGVGYGLYGLGKLLADVLG